MTLDQQIADFVARTEKRKVSDLLLPVLLFIVLVGFTLNSLQIASYARSTNKSVTKTIPILRQGIQKRDQTISDYQSVTKQATDAIVAECNQIRELGGTCPHIVLLPPEHSK
jgi:predicted PurR-regulated permease PerM